MINTLEKYGISYGVRMMFLATFLFSLMNICIKKIPHIPAVEIIFFRTIISFFVTAFALKIQSIPFFGNNKKILIFRGLLGTGALILLFATIQNIPLATAVLIFNLSPIFTAILASIFLNEKLYKMQWLFWGISFVGIVLIRNFDSRISLTYFVFGVIAAMMAGGAYNCIRKLKLSEHPLVIVFYFPLVAFPVSTVLSYFVWVMPQSSDWFFLIAIGLLTQLAQFFLTKAYQNEKAEKIANTSYLSIIFGLLYGFTFFGETFDTFVIIGMFLVFLGILLNLNFKPKTK